MSNKPAKVAAVVALCLIAAGCGSSPDAGGPSGSSVDESGLAAAKAAIAPYEKPPTSIGIDEPLSSRPEGATMAYLECGVPECSTIGDYMEPAAAAMGVTLRRIDAGNTPETIQKAMDTVVQSEPDAVIIPALDPAIYPDQLKQLEADGIPVVIWTVSNPVGGALVANLINDTDAANDGKLLADYAIAKSGATAKVLYVTVPEFTVFKTQEASFSKEIADSCTSCTTETISISVADLGQAAPGRIVSYLQQNPDTDYVVGAFGSVLAGVPEALQGAGLKDVNTLTQAGVPTNFQYLKDGKQTADLALDKQILAWKGIDAAARAIVGDPLDADQANPIPIQFLTQDAIDFDPADDWTSVPDFQDQFKGLWGIE